MLVLDLKTSIEMVNLNWNTNNLDIQDRHTPNYCPFFGPSKAVVRIGEMVQRAKVHETSKKHIIYTMTS